MIMVPGRLPMRELPKANPVLEFFEAICVLGFFIAWFAFWIWLYFEFFY